MILYFIVKFFVSIAFRLFYRKIYVKGLEHIPKDKPVLICSNHPNGFIEPLLIGFFLKDYIYFLVRGDLFDKPFLGWFLRNSQQIPIYRKRDGIKNLRNNKSTMDWINSALAEHKKILLFPEGGTEPVKHLRPLQKGVARMAFDFMESYPEEDLQILPVTINYTYPYKIRSEVMVSVAPAISIKDYLPAYVDHRQKAYRGLLNDLGESLSDNLIKVENDENLNLYEQLAPLFRRSIQSTSCSVIQRTTEELDQEVTLANRISAANDEQKNTWKRKLTTIKSLLGTTLINQDYTIPTSNSWLSMLYLILGLFPSVIGKYFHIIPSILPKKIADKYSKNDVFWSSLYLSVSIGTYFFYYIFVAIVSVVLFGVKGLLITLVMLLLGWFHIQYDFFAKRFRQNSKFSNVEHEQDLNKLINELKNSVFGED